MSCAQAILIGHRGRAGGRNSRDAVGEFLNIAADLPYPAYRPCFLETLGFIVRILEPQSIPAIAGFLRGHGEDHDLFWHGSGRGLYFTALQVVPSVRWRHWSLDRAVLAAPDAGARANLLSGFFWAMTLVNMRHPEVIVYFLSDGHLEHWKADASGISDGVSAALLLWHHLTGDDAVTDHFLGPLRSQPQDGLRRFWEDQIVSFSRRRLTDEYERLRRDDRIADIFRFQER